ncbi:hypothetical protein [Neoaquamicrobium sediminum]|uniref:hypothetical protein n=1 Tax=Neoaquamicrobium sediminum TaxID=1849104 RepID=UPI003BACF791
MTDMLQLSRAIAAKFAAADPEPLDHLGSFMALVWEDFLAREVMEILLDERSSYRGHKDVLTAAFFAWMLHPKHLGLRRNAIRLAAMRHFERAERKALKELPNGGWAADAVYRYRDIGIKFLVDVYYPIGGMGSLLRATARLNHSRLIRKKYLRQIFSCVEIVRIYHYAVDHLHPPAHRKPSLQGATTVVRKVADTIESTSATKDAWARRRPSIAYIYAASTIETANGNTLLHDVIDKNIDFKSVRPHLRELVGRARFVADQILARAVEPVGESAEAVPTVEPIPFTVRMYGNVEAALIGEAFADPRHNF